MDKTSMPANISYTLLIHGGSYKDFTKKIAANFPHLIIKSTKQVAIHYHIVVITEDGQVEYKKEDIYQLPIMAMREEFSNYLFFKKMTGYNNALKFMCGAENKDAPYQLYQEMMTPFEKLKYAEVSSTTKKISMLEKDILTSYYGNTIFEPETLNKIFQASKIKTDDKEYNFVELIKDQKLSIGIL